PRFALFGSIFLLLASSLTASPIVILSNPLDFRASAIVVFPAPGIPVKHTISLGTSTSSHLLIYEVTGKRYTLCILNSSGANICGSRDSYSGSLKFDSQNAVRSYV